MSRTSGLLNPCIELYDSSGKKEASACPGYNSAAELDWTLLNSGLYTIVVEDDGRTDIGKYCLSLLLIPGPTVSPGDPDGGTIISGEIKKGAISSAADTDTYTFNGLVGEVVKITMSRTSGLLNPCIELYDGSGRREASACPGYNSAAELNQTLLQSGLYTIVLGDDGRTDTGNYNLSLTTIPASPVSPALLLNLNQNVFHTGDTLIISAHVVNGPNPATVEVKTWVSLPAGSDIPILDSHLVYQVPANADFTAEIFRYQFNGSEPSGDYLAGGRLVNPLTGRELSASVQVFNFSP
jgi:hypothetical protein